ncbi:MAG TPA: YeeE/YedE thiosulfate transporter family protein [Gemmatimonadales bacterium]|nr:YeeE/YedE thiosulfate transporter family protein [Gemmatimonadales bacterium]
MRLLLGLLTGLGFGFALQRAGFSRCGTVQRGLWLRDFTMLKVMVTAIVVGMVGAYLLGAFAPAAAHFKVKPVLLWAQLVGGALFGVGMAFGGYCPGTAVVGLGARVGEGAAAVAGGLLGALAFIFAYPALKPLFVERGDLGKLTIPGVLGLPPLAVALGAALLLSAALWGLVRIERRGAEREAGASQTGRPR